MRLCRTSLRGLRSSPATSAVGWCAGLETPPGPAILGMGRKGGGLGGWRWDGRGGQGAWQERGFRRRWRVIGGLAWAWGVLAGHAASLERLSPSAKGAYRTEFFSLSSRGRERSHGRVRKSRSHEPMWTESTRTRETRPTESTAWGNAARV
jgi:hypothetical protein